MQRRPGSVFVPDVHVFPGGRIDNQDYELVERGLTTGWPVLGTETEVDRHHQPDRQPRWSLADSGSNDSNSGDIDGGLPRDLAFWVAALRETFEETGLLLARPAASSNATLDPGWLEAASAERAAVDAGERTMSDVCADHGLRLDTAAMAYFGHWTTPVGAPRRYDTQFFVAQCPPNQDAEPDGVEALAVIWRTPANAVRACLDHEIDLILPTYRSLVALARFSSSEEVLDALSPLEAKTGRMVREEGGGFRVALPAWEEQSRNTAEGAEPFPRIPPEIRARRGIND